MKNTIFLLVFMLLVISFNINSQWQPDVRLTNDTGDSYTSNNNGWCVAANGNVVHVAWADRRGTYVQIYYKRSLDGGMSWGADTQLTTHTWYYTGNPSITVSGSDVHLIWIYNHNASNELYYKHSSDGGLSWGSNINFGSVSAGGFVSKQPSISSSGSNIHLVWAGKLFFNINSDIYYKRSTNGGINWSADTLLLNDPSHSFNPSVSVSGQAVHVVWQDMRDGNWEIYYKRSSNNGISWGTDIRLTNNPDSSFYPSVSVSGPIVNITWVEARDGNWEIYHKRSSDEGLNWGADIRLTNSPDSSWNPSISASGSIVHAIWQDKRDGNWEIYYKLSTDGGVNWDADTRLTNNSAYSQFPFISISGTVVHVVWTDNREGNNEIYYKRNPTGNPLGIININTEIPKEFSLSQNYPNPFNPTTKIRFQLNMAGQTFLSIYDILGRKITTLVNEQLQPGTYEADWDGSNYPSGVYYYKLNAGSFSETRKMILIK